MTDSRDSDSHGLSGFGYKQRLDRSLGGFATFAAGVSYISILTGIFQLFFFGAAVAGPGYWWTWVVVAVFQLFVALLFAELAGKWPVAGSVYNWGKRLGSRGMGWFSGWMMLGAGVLAVASVGLALQVTLPAINPDFQFIGDGTGEYDVPTNAVILGSALIVLACIVNSLGVRILAKINSFGVAVELVAAVLLVLLLLVNSARGPDVVIETNNLGDGREWGYFGALLVASIAAAYTIWGFDTAGSLGEESRDPRRTAPGSILRAVIASAVIGGLLILAAFMAAPSITDENIATGGLQYIVKDVLGNTLGNLFLWAVVVAITVCMMAIMAATTRMIFAMARDNALPGSRRLAALSERGTPILPNIVISLLAIGLLVINIRQPQIILVVTSLSIIACYLAYLTVTGSLLVARLRGRWQAPRDGFSLGRFGLVINFAAVLWGIAMIVNLAWPRKEIYNAVEPFHWYLQYGAFVFLGAFILIGIGLYSWRRGQTRVLGEHAEAESVDEGAEPALEAAEAPARP